MKCKECDTSMYLDDTDIIKRKSKDEYWNCPHCKTSCIVEYRCGLLMGENWHTENNGNVKDEYIDRFGGK